MSKNLTRRGLAFGAIVALSSTVLAGSTAFAVGELVVAPAVGTSNTTLVTETFNLKTTFAPSFSPSSYAQLKYQVVTDGTDVNLTTGAALQTVTNVDGATVFAGGSTVAANTTVVASTGATGVSVNYLGINLDGAAGAARVVGSTNRFFIGVDGNTLARNVVVKVAGRTFATLKGSATNRSYAVRAPKGSHKVTVFVGGKPNCNQDHFCKIIERV